MKWIETARSRWQQFKAAPPGKRFEGFYEERKRARKKGAIGLRVVVVALGVVFTAVGILFLAMPGPGSLVIALGLALIATESRRMAKFLDAVEVWVRKWWEKAGQMWRRLTPAQRVLGTTLAGLIVVGALGTAWICVMHS